MPTCWRDPVVVFRAGAPETPAVQQCRDVRAWRVHEFGEPEEVLRLEEVPPPVAGPHELLVRVAATTLNFNDVDGVRGRYRTVCPPLPYTPGMEVLGSVEGAGLGAEEWIGRRVVAVPSGAFGGYAELAVGPRAMAFEMPPEPDLPDTPAAAVYFPFHLSWLALHDRANVRAGESVLIHAAAGGVGSAAVQLAVLAGARVIATAGSAEKVELCRSLGADVAINYRDHDFVDAVLDATDGRGVDVAFDSVGGEVTTRTFRCMAFNGRHLLVGFASGIEAEDEGIVPRPVLFGNFSLSGVCLAYAEDPAALKRVSGFNFPSHADGTRVHARILDLIWAGSVRPVVGREVAFDDLPRALQAMADRRTVGRTVARLGPRSDDELAEPTRS
jgi:NADPH:quinone reductase